MTQRLLTDAPAPPERINKFVKYEYEYDLGEIACYVG